MGNQLPVSTRSNAGCVYVEQNALIHVRDDISFTHRVMTSAAKQVVLKIGEREVTILSWFSMDWALGADGDIMFQLGRDH